MQIKYNIEEIADYLNGKLEPSKALAVKQDATEDPALAGEIEAQRKLSRLVQIAALQKELDIIHVEYYAEEPNIVSINQTVKKKLAWPLIAIAAAITGLAIFLTIYKSAQPFNTKLFNQYYTDDNGTPSLMGNKSSSFDEAMVYYKSGDYQKAASDFNSLHNQQKSNDTLKYYEALCQVKLNNNPKALKLLGAISTKKGGDLYVKTAWYTALVLVKQGETKKALPILEDIQTYSSSLYAKKAASLKNDIIKNQRD